MTDPFQEPEGATNLAPEERRGLSVADNQDFNHLSTLPIPSSGISISAANIVRRGP
jgi:hypothetical protein